MFARVEYRGPASDGYDDIGRLEPLTSYSDTTGTTVANQVNYEYAWGRLVATIKDAARKLTGPEKRAFQAKVVRDYA